MDQWQLTLAALGGIAGFVTAIGGLITAVTLWRRRNTENKTDIVHIFQEDNEGLRQREEQWQQERGELRRQLDTLEDRVNILERELRTTQLENTQLRAENKQLRTDYQEAERHIEQLKSDLSTEKARTTRLTERVRQLEHRAQRRDDGGELG